MSWITRSRSVRQKKIYVGFTSRRATTPVVSVMLTTRIDGMAAVLATDAKPWSYHPICNKCQYVGASTTYCPGATDTTQDVAGCAYAGQGEHMHEQCSQCSYKWVTWTQGGAHS
jgi:hypothetical protein